MGFTAKSLAQHLRSRCLREFGDSTKTDYAPGDHYFELSNVFRGGAVKSHEEGVYHFTISEEIMRLSGHSSDSQWQCTIYVTRDLDVFIDDCREFDGSQGLPARKLLTQILSCGVRGRD